MSTAYVTINSSLDMKQDGAGICFKPLDASRFRSAELEISLLLKESCKETNTLFKMQKDSYGYLWVILHDNDFEDLVTTLYLVSETLKEHNFGSSYCVRFSNSGANPLFTGYTISNRRVITRSFQREKKGLLLMSSGCAQYWTGNCQLRRTCSGGILCGIFRYSPFLRLEIMGAATFQEKRCRIN
jgi:hypothetical protein